MSTYLLKMMTQVDPENVVPDQNGRLRIGIPLIWGGWGYALSVFI